MLHRFPLLLRKIHVLPSTPADGKAGLSNIHKWADNAALAIQNQTERVAGNQSLTNTTSTSTLQRHRQAK
ncbi:hypothetical protein [Chitinimonas sp. BJB300]|uniref:hypothetical protein n=1 Tax=Chitinimonas sp. BJB300 TaxID=1559339 RepID=UPI000C105FE8|nr:hypothetical protein [Chitinimonas sp. BJB300]PHV10638.1 hypothetical protein CSQ89_15155 [Chitinimonas sp. BJB300]